jgi:hypothetical protein
LIRKTVVRVWGRPRNIPEGMISVNHGVVHQDSSRLPDEVLACRLRPAHGVLPRQCDGGALLAVHGSHCATGAGCPSWRQMQLGQTFSSIRTGALHRSHRLSDNTVHSLSVPSARNGRERLSIALGPTCGNAGCGEWGGRWLLNAQG